MPPRRTTKDAVLLKPQRILGIKVITLSWLKLTIMIMNVCILKHPVLNETIHDETPHTSPQNIQAFKEREEIKDDTMGQEYIPVIMPEPDPKVSTSTNVQGIFLSHIEEFGEVFNYHSNITQE
ncbi:hypothetical protein O181_083861 [Austropuccinia psidii MF-1]|uniref:Uncharacterized protein n=1 Tax=Austropuccinia psidii MF-1 TaxID=1389203 RepID=A0A9Q3FVE1_9BASI|nr:hypothetical protein [Austropuccinia psidii MF-1]